MRQTKIYNILENIIALTSERDSIALELALAQTLFKFAAPGNINLYRASSIDSVKYENTLLGSHYEDNEVIPVSLLDDLKKCLDSNQSVETQYEGNPLTLFPLQSAKNKPIAVIAFQEEGNVKDHEVIIMILKIYHNFVSLMNENERDTLTGLLNRKTFDQKISSIISTQKNEHHKRSNDSNDPCYLAIFDIDHFKHVNDTFGHLMGDEVLLTFSRIMVKSFRESDMLFRFGGEEFIGIFRCPSDELMLNVLNRLRTNVEKHEFPQVGHITVSCGFTKIEPFDISATLIDRADVALYHAKNNGRNQVCQHEHLVAAGVLQQNDTSGDIELF
jgi:diguanylate cyclase (GGDEF)-like protein